MADGVAGSDARELATEILRLLAENGETVAAAESLTGGLVAAALTDVPGSSKAFRGGVVAYATELKAALLGVDSDMLEDHGPSTRRSRRRWPTASGSCWGRRSAWPPPESRGLTRPMASRQAPCTSR